MSSAFKWVLPCPTGTEQVLADELRALEVTEIKVGRTAVYATGTLSDGYRMSLGSRVASRVLHPLCTWDGGDTAMYDNLRAHAWWEHLAAGDTFAISHSVHRRAPTPGHYAVQRAKDAIVDAIRDHTGQRPSVDKRTPSLRFHLHVAETGGELSLDFSGSLHERGYRVSGGGAPLKENLAAAILYLAGWPEAARAGLPLVDPTCGSGTILTEAAWMAHGIAPGLLRQDFGFERWLQHDKEAYRDARGWAESQQRLDVPTRIYGFDASSEALELARRQMTRAQVADHVVVAKKNVVDLEKPVEQGILVCNPPYGHRLGDAQTLFLFYQQLGDALKRGFDGWTAFVFAAHNEQLKHIGLKPAKRHTLFNGSIECRLLELPMRGPAGDPGWRKPSSHAPMFANRVRKNARKLRSWSKQAKVECFRVYDTDIPEYRVAVDVYGPHAVVHVRSDRVESRERSQKLQDVVQVLPDALGIPRENVHVKVRLRHEEGDQYARLATTGAPFEVQEGPLRFEVNVNDRIDTGLFLDHRTVRRDATKRTSGERMLNLFSYTCSVSVAAAHAGAVTTSVDLSNTYLDWGKRNFQLNGQDPNDHRFVRDDAMPWLRRCRDTYDWIFVNPPTFSRSKKTSGDFKIHRDHRVLIDQCVRLLADGGEVLFTTHARDFELAGPIYDRFSVERLGHTLVPRDFARTPFYAFRIRK